MVNLTDDIFDDGERGLDFGAASTEDLGRVRGEAEGTRGEMEMVWVVGVEGGDWAELELGVEGELGMEVELGVGVELLEVEEIEDGVSIKNRLDRNKSSGRKGDEVLYAGGLSPQV